MAISWLVALFIGTVFKYMVNNNLGDNLIDVHGISFLNRFCAIKSLHIENNQIIGKGATDLELPYLTTLRLGSRIYMIAKNLIGDDVQFLLKLKSLV